MTMDPQDILQDCDSAIHWRANSDRSMTRSQARSSAVLPRVIAVLLCVLLFTMDSLAEAADETIGGKDGWTLKHDYGHITVQRGTDLRFYYKRGSHDVIPVTEKQYKKCIVPSRPTRKYSSGKDSIRMNKPGEYYFICGFPGHCADGMKVAVSVR